MPWIWDGGTYKNDDDPPLPDWAADDEDFNEDTDSNGNGDDAPPDWVGDEDFNGDD